MIDDSELFDKDDTIIIHKDKITLIKYNNEKSLEDLKKSMKELDGNWELDIYNEENIISPESWISKNEKHLILIFQDIKHTEIYSAILSKLTYTNLCDYLESSSKSNYIFDNNDWNLYEEYKLYGMKKPNIQEWTSFHILELHKLYSTYNEYFKLGKIEEFINFCFINSETKRLPQY